MGKVLGLELKDRNQVKDSFFQLETLKSPVRVFWMPTFWKSLILPSNYLSPSVFDRE